MSQLIIPQWPAPANVRACSTTRHGGVSAAPWQSLNLGQHVGDDPQHVMQNRALLQTAAKLPQAPLWLEQTHSTRVVSVAEHLKASAPVQADAAWSREVGKVCAVMTADCLPVIFCSLDGQQVAAAHAGWRGLCDGILENTLKTFTCPPNQIMAWLGPSIGPQAFEVGEEVKEAFVQQDPHAETAFFHTASGKYLANLWELAEQRLKKCGVNSIYAEKRCTWHESDDFFSYRRDGKTGRMATLIWLV